MTAVFEPPVVPAGLVLASTVAELRSAVAARSGRVGLVPTMGALHEGHASLIEHARGLVDGPVVVSIFVNPLQFAAGEDLDRYPRTLAADLEVCVAAGADIVFAPGVDEVYPTQPEVTVSPGPLGTILEGAIRPTHFSGVLTVVAKLFGLVRPDVAVFGEKDFQQLTLIRRMVSDLNMGIEVVGAPTIRDADGLAKSSRNRYLSDDERTAALVLSAALRAAARAGARGVAAADQAALAVLADRPEIDVDYLVIRAEDLTELPAFLDGPTEARVLIAARVGSTRLIDNLPLTVGASASSHES